MCSWLYNEAGFPSGFASGLVRQKHPELYYRSVSASEITVKAGTAYEPSENGISAFVVGERIHAGDTFDTDTTVIEFIVVDGDAPRCTRTDNAKMLNVETFLEVTHEALKKRFGDAMGTDVTLMFDDEAFMGQWTDGFDTMFQDRYGYDVLDYAPVIFSRKSPTTDAEYRAKSDYTMLCGDLICDNYFLPMKKWLNEHNMESTGHIDNDHATNGTYRKRYGNLMRSLRAFDVPGVDVIWSQITYPEAVKNDPYQFDFFPLIASSAARQCGHSKCLSESFAVYGSHVTPEEMRFGVNVQAVRGISLFNFMSITFDRSTAMSLQCRPNFHSGNLGMDCLGQINNYTARLSKILQESKADIHTALYYPLRSIGACGEKGLAAEKSFRDLGNMLESACVSFDIIDEELVANATVENGTLICKNVRYDNVFIPLGEFEQPEIIEKLEKTGKEIVPVIGRTRRQLLARKLTFDNADECYFITSCAGDTIRDTIEIKSTRIPYAIDLETGDICEIEYKRVGSTVRIPVKLLRGEGIMILFCDNPQNVKPIAKEIDGTRRQITEFTAYMSRRYTLDKINAPLNEFFTESNGEKLDGLTPWDISYSGEATYTAKIPDFDTKDGTVMLDLGSVHHFAKVYLNGEKIGEVTMPPYTLSLGCPFHKVKPNDELKIVVANTISNVCHNAKFFEPENTPAYYAGPYHANMRVYEEKYSVAGGLLGPVSIYVVK